MAAQNKQLMTQANQMMQPEMVDQNQQSTTQNTNTPIYNPSPDESASQEIKSDILTKIGTKLKHYKKSQTKKGGK